MIKPGLTIWPLRNMGGGGEIKFVQICLALSNCEKPEDRQGSRHCLGPYQVESENW